MRKQLAADGIADGIHLGKIGAHLVIDDDLAALAEREAERRGIDAGECRPPPDGHKHIIRAEGARRTALLGANHDARAVAMSAGHLGGGVHLEALPGEDTSRFLDDVVVVARQDGRRVLDDSDHRAQATPDGSELEANDTTADHDEVLRHLGDAEGADVRQDTLFIERQEWQLDGEGAGRDDDVLGAVLGDGAVECRHVDDVAGLQRAEAFGPGDFVLLEQELDAFGVLRDNLVLALHHAGEIEAQALEVDAVFGSVESCELEVFGGAEEGFARDATDVDAGATEGFVEFDADGGEA